MVCVILERPDAACTNTDHHVAAITCRVRSPSTIGTRTDLLLYVADLLKVVKRHRLSPHAYADDTQIYGFCQPSDVNALADSVRLLRCLGCGPTGCR